MGILLKDILSFHLENIIRLCQYLGFYEVPRFLYLEIFPGECKEFSLLFSENFDTRLRGVLLATKLEQLLRIKCLTWSQRNITKNLEEILESSLPLDSSLEMYEEFFSEVTGGFDGLSYAELDASHFKNSL